MSAALTPPPLSMDMSQKGGKMTGPWLVWFQNAYNLIKALGGNGATGTRPTANTYVGQQFFDSTLGKPVFLKQVNPAVWVDATGAVV